MPKAIKLIIFLLFFSSSVLADDCETGNKSVKYNLLKTEHTVIYSLPEVCKPQLIEEFSVIKDYENPDLPPVSVVDYSINWSKQFHDLWHVASYEVRVNNDDNDVRFYEHDQTLPVTIELPIPGPNQGLAKFEIRACSALPDVDPVCGDWQSTATQCENWCTDNSYVLPQISLPNISINGDFQVSWSESQYPDYELQRSISASAFETTYEGTNLIQSFDNQSNDIYAFQVRNRNDNIYSKYSPAQVIAVELKPPVLNLLSATNDTGDYIVSWAPAIYEVDSYQLEQSDDDGASWDNITLISDRTHSFINQGTNTIYKYQITACRIGNNCSAPSAPVSIEVQLEVPLFESLEPQNTTGNYDVKWFDVDYDDPDIRYQLEQKIDSGPWSLQSNGRSYSKSYTSQQAGSTYHYKVRACRLGGNCSEYSEETSVLVSALSMTSFDVYQDLSTSRRYLTWHVDDENGITNYQISAKIGTQVVETYYVDANNPPHLTLEDISPTEYLISACNLGSCGEVIADSDFGQGLVRPENLTAEWVQNNTAFIIHFNYDENVFATIGGEPDTFKISATFPQQDGSFLLDTVNQSEGGTEFGWFSKELVRDEVIGSSFTVEACNGELGCSYFESIAVGEAIDISGNIPQPVFLSAIHDPINETITLLWEADNDVTDYITVVENQPLLKEAQTDISSVNDDFESSFQTHNIDEPLVLNRYGRGDYSYNIYACKSNKGLDIDDECSNMSQAISVTIPNCSSNCDFGSLDPSSGFYLDGDKKQLKWKLIGNQKPIDYFYVWGLQVRNPITQDYGKLAECEIQEYSDVFDPTINDYPVVLKDSNKIRVYNLESHKTDDGEFTTEGICKSLKDTDVVTGGQITNTDDLGYWKIMACVNGIGCQTVGEVNDQDFITPPLGPQTPEIINSSNSGPNTFRPGSYWHHGLDGTGWNFFWVNGLNQSAQDGRYGRTYDLVGYWFTFRRHFKGDENIEEIWTPTWIEARLKISNDLTNSDDVFFTGSLYSHKWEGSDDLVNYPNGGFTAEKEVGRIQLKIDRSLSDEGILELDLDYSAGIFSVVPESENIWPYEKTGSNKLQLKIKDIGELIHNQYEQDNDADHYSGLWQDGIQDPEAPLSSAKLSMLTWIRGGLESTTVLYYDNHGDPIWAITQSKKQFRFEDPDWVSTGEPVPLTTYYNGYITPNGNTDVLYTIPKGYNPLRQKSIAWKASEKLKFIGDLGRQFELNAHNDSNFREAGLQVFVNRTLYSDITGLPENLRRSLNISEGSTNYPQPPDFIPPPYGDLLKLEKRANFHGIFYQIDGQSINLEKCDPNNIGPCDILFTWYTDDQFHSIEPYYKKLGMNEYRPLTELCSSLIGTEFYPEVIAYRCSIESAGTYDFQLHKDKYGSQTETIAIAQSKTLVIKGCNDPKGCEYALTAPPILNADPAIKTGSYPASGITHQDGSGPIPGSGGVSGGAATYSIPINIPPGRNGMTPSLSINYSSKGGSGIMGMGWSHSLGSSIYRCPATVAQDEYFHAVDNSASDRLCLDGQKLKVVSGDYLISGSEYRTEIDSFAKIKLLLNELTVYTKLGRVKIYKQLGLQKSTWYLTQESDSFGNNIIYQYNKYGNNLATFGTNELLLTEVYYTGTGNNRGNRKIVYDYSGTQFDVYEQYYQVGVQSEKTRYLNNIKTYVDGDLVRTYQFNYRNSNSSHSILIDEITETSGSVTRNLTEQLNWSDLYWDEEGNNFDHYTYSDFNGLGSAVSGITEELLGRATISSDFDGDGIKEFMTTSKDGEKRKLLFFNSDNQLKAVLGLGGTNGYKLANVVGNADFNVDGITDMVVITKNHTNNCEDSADRENALRIFSWNNAKTLEHEGFVDSSVDTYFESNDYCGDLDLDDYVVNLNNGPDITLDVNIEKSRFYLSDYNHDGKQDILLLRVPFIPGNLTPCYPFDSDCIGENDGANTYSDILVYENTTNCSGASCSLSLTQQSEPLTSILTYGDREAEAEIFMYMWDSIDDMDDYNGDGLPDFHVRTWYQISVTEESHSNYAVRNDRILFSSLNANGDLSVSNRNLRSLGLSDFKCDLADGTLTSENCYTSTNSLSHAHGYKFTDINGDGLKDYLYYDKGDEYLRSWKVRLNKGGSDLNNLFADISIKSVIDTVENLSFLDQGDECKNLGDGASDEMYRMCNAYFRIAAEFVDLNGDGIQEFAFPDPDPEAVLSDDGVSYQSDNLPFNYCGQFQAESGHLFDFSILELVFFENRILSGPSNIPYLPDGVGDIVHDSGSSISNTAEWLNSLRSGIDDITFPETPNTSGATETKFACSYSHKENRNDNDVNDIYRDFGSLSATYDHGIYPYKALSFKLKENIQGEVILDLSLSEKTGIYKPLFSGSIGDINGDGLVDVFSAMGCVQSADNACRDAGGSIVNIDAIDYTGNSNPWAGIDGIGGNLKNNGGVAVASHAVVQTPNLLESIEKPTTGEIIEWDFNPISKQLPPSRLFPLYDLPERGNGAGGGYIDQAGGEGEYFYFNSSMFVVSEMRQTNSIDGGLSATQYGYEEAVYNNKGRGFQGFRTIKVLNDPNMGSGFNQTLSESTFHQIFPLAGRLDEVQTYQIQAAQTKILSNNTYDFGDPLVNLSTNSSDGVNFHPLLNSVSEKFDPGSTSSSTYRTQTITEHDASHSTCNGYNSAFDDYGNVLCEQVISKDRINTSQGLQTTTRKSETRNTYNNVEADWWLGKLDTTVVTSSIAENGGMTKPADYQVSDLDSKITNKYIWQTTGVGRKLSCSYVVGNDASIPQSCSATSIDNVDTLLTSFEYDANDYGLVTEVTTSGLTSNVLSNLPVLQDRTVNTYYDVYEGYFPDRTVQIAPGSNLTTRFTYDLTSGQVTQSTDPNGVVTNIALDDFQVPVEQEILVGGESVEQVSTTSMTDCPHSSCTAAQLIVNGVINNIKAKIEGEYEIQSSPTDTGHMIYDLDLNTGFFFNEGDAHYPKIQFVSESRQVGKPMQTNWHDQNGQVILTKTQHSGGQSYVMSLTNPLGQLEVVTQPFESSTDPYFTFNAYNELGRLETRLTRVGAMTADVGSCWRDTTYLHDKGLTNVAAYFVGDGCDADAENELQMSRSYDSSGQIRQTVDDMDFITKYWYDAQDNPYIIADADDNPIITEFDHLGRKESVSDPNMGLKTFSYNAFGEVTFEQDAEQLDSGAQMGNRSYYDSLGRLTTKFWNVDEDNSPQGLLAYQDSYVYPMAYADCGSLTALCDEFRSSNFNGDAAVFDEFFAAQRKSYSYDGYGRPTREEIQFTDVLSGLSSVYDDNAEYAVDYYYYENHNYLRQKVFNRKDIRGLGEDSFFSVVDHYDVYGGNWKQTSSDAAMSELMRFDTYNFRGQPLEKVAFNGVKTTYSYYPSTGQLSSINNESNGDFQLFEYEFDAWGNINTQTFKDMGNVDGVSETFKYDRLQRIINSEVGSEGEITYDYDNGIGLGNLTVKSDFASLQSYSKTCNAGPNAITSSTLNVTGVVTIDYCYDLKGNRIQSTHSALGESTFNYDPNNLLVKATRSDAESTVHYRYGIDQQRYLKFEDSLELEIDSGESDRTKEFTVYAGGQFEEIINYEYLTREIKLQVSDSLNITVHGNDRIEKHLLQKDRLGSTTQILGEQGEIIKRMSYDVFGKPRNGDTWIQDDFPELDFSSGGSIDITKRGFTDHEHLDNFELIHMNGRMYDFNNGRFLSVDPFIQGTTSQAINPYSYIQNNPLSGVDPTGYAIEDLFNDPHSAGHQPSLNEVSTDVVNSVSDSTAVTVGLAVVEGLFIIDEVSDNVPGTGTIKKEAKKALGIRAAKNKVKKKIGAFKKQREARAKIAKRNGNKNNSSSSNNSTQVDEIGAEKNKPKVNRSEKLPEKPDDITKKGYQETSHPDAKKAGHRTFENPKTGDKVRHDKGKPGKPGYEGKDHYHRSNPDATGKKDQYLDKDGNPCARGCDESHLMPEKK